MIKVEAVNIPNISDLFPKYSNMSNIFPGSAPFWQYSPIATSHLPSSLNKETAILLIEYIMRGIWIQKIFFLFLTLLLTA